MTDSLQERIYRTHWYSNVEPVEFMVPYPNLPALVEGETVKFSQRSLFEDTRLTNGQFRTLVHAAGGWLKSRGVSPGDRIFFGNQAFPNRQILAFACWSVGASLVLLETGVNESVLDPGWCAFDLSGEPIPIRVDSPPDSVDYIPPVKPLLGTEAAVIVLPDRRIRLSHYQLLLNANGIMRGLDLNDRMRFYSSLRPGSLAALIFETVLPFYSGAVFSGNNPQVIIGYSGQFPNQTHVLIADLNPDPQTNELTELPEAGGILRIGRQPLPMTEMDTWPGSVLLRGHGVMMGYLEEELNERRFTGSGLLISF